MLDVSPVFLFTKGPPRMFAFTVSVWILDDSLHAWLSLVAINFGSCLGIAEILHGQTLRGCETRQVGLLGEKGSCFSVPRVDGWVGAHTDTARPASPLRYSTCCTPSRSHLSLLRDGCLDLDAFHLSSMSTCSHLHIWFCAANYIKFTGAITPRILHFLISKYLSSFNLASELVSFWFPGKSCPASFPFIPSKAIHFPQAWALLPSVCLSICYCSQ